MKKNEISAEEMVVYSRGSGKSGLQFAYFLSRLTGIPVEIIIAMLEDTRGEEDEQND